MSLEYIGTNNIIEINPFGHLFLNDPLTIFILFLFTILFYFLFNIILLKKFQELIPFLFSILILLNLIGFYILFNNFTILRGVNG